MLPDDFIKNLKLYMVIEELSVQKHAYMVPLQIRLPIRGITKYEGSKYKTLFQILKVFFVQGEIFVVYTKQVGSK